MKITFTIQIDTDKENPVVIESVPSTSTTVKNPIEDIPAPANKIKPALGLASAPVVVKKPKDTVAVKEIKPKGKRHGSRELEPLPDDMLIPADFNSKYVTIQNEKIEGTTYPPHISRVKRDEDFRTEERPYLSVDVKRLMEKFGVTVQEVAHALGMLSNDFRNVISINTRMFTKQEYFVILKAINTVLEKKEMIEDLI